MHAHGWKTIAWLLGAVTSFAFSQQGRAQDAGFFVGASVGKAKYASCAGASAFTSSSLQVAPSCDDSDTAWRLFGGYQLNRYFSAELGFADLGHTSGALPSSATITTSTGRTLDTETTAWDVTGIVAFPIGERFSLFGKLGLYQANVKTRTTTTQGLIFVFPPVPPVTSVTESSADSSGVTLGLGMRYDLARHVAVRVEWQRYKGVGDGATGGRDIDVLSGGLVYHF
jgi:OmpA-OmpF porin, OOP family